MMGDAECYELELSVDQCQDHPAGDRRTAVGVARGYVREYGTQARAQLEARERPACEVCWAYMDRVAERLLGEATLLKCGGCGQQVPTMLMAEHRCSSEGMAEQKDDEATVSGAGAK